METCNDCIHAAVCGEPHIIYKCSGVCPHFKNGTNDAVSVVRCRECKHAYINSFSDASGVALCRLLAKRAEGIQIVMQQDDFCSYGERKEGAD